MDLAIFIVLLIVVAGLVAAAGDRMGQLAAKRKIRIGKLRPRDASRLVAVLTGMAISVVTFGVVFAIWSDFREALTRYRETKDSLASVLAERDSMLEEISEAQKGRDAAFSDRDEAVDARAEAEQQTTEAQNKLLAVEDQLLVADAQIKDKEQELLEKQVEVDNKQLELDQARQELADIEKQKQGDRIQLEALGDLKEKARADIDELNEIIEGLKESEVEIALGKVLSYHEIPPGTENVVASLQDAIDRVQINMLRRGYEIDPQSVNAARELAGSLELGEFGNVVVIRSGRNVFRDDEEKLVLLDFSALPQVPIVRSGSDFLTIRVTEQGSQVFVLGSSSSELNLGSNVDFNFVKRLDEFFQQAALDAGFLPELSSGTISFPPFNEIQNMAIELNQREKPYEIHIRAPRDMTAIDGARGIRSSDAADSSSSQGLGELEIVVSGVSQ